MKTKKASTAALPRAFFKLLLCGVAAALSAAPGSANGVRLSTRALVQTGDYLLISGFAITGNAPKKVLLRALGPSLTGVSGQLGDPVLELHDGNGSLIVSNDNWRDTQQAEIQATGQAPPNNLESAIIGTLPPGNYTATVSGKNGTMGIGMVDITDLDSSSDSQLASISSRAHTGVGDDVIVGGVIINGPQSQKIIIRGIGPSLAASGVPFALQDPTLQLRDSNGNQLVFNDNWRDTQQAEIQASGLPPTDDRESAIVATLAPDSYTAVLEGACSSAGIALVEIYNLGPAGNTVAIPASSSPPPCSPTPSFSIDNVRRNEGNAGPTTYVFTVTKTGSTTLSSSVDFATQDGTATMAGNDYQAAAGTLTFAPSDTTKAITVLVNGDTTFEADETFTVHLSNATNAIIAVADGTGTIVNDDVAPSFSIDSVAHNEGNAGTTSYVFTVTKTGSTTLSASVSFTTQDGTATVAGNDYKANAGTLTFAPTDTAETIAVLVNGDTTFEADETFTVHLSNATNGIIAVADGTGTIVNDDVAPSFSIDSVAHNEGNAGTTSYVFTVTKTGSTTLSASVSFTTQDGTATVAGNDYKANAGTLTFAPTDTAETIAVLVNGDTTFEADETFTVHLSNATNGIIAVADGTGTITNDDATPSFSIDNIMHAEGNAGPTAYVFTVTKTGSTALNASVSFTTQDGTATLADNDYQSNAGTLTFAPTDTTKTITVLVNGDTVVEPNETFTVHLSNASNATIAVADGTGTITNDDPAPSFSIDNVTQYEGNAGTTPYVFTVTKTGSTAVSATVSFATQDVTATVADNDYQANAGTLTFAPTDTTQTITVLVNGDTTFEQDETFTVHLSNATNATITIADGTGTISNDDPPAQLLNISTRAQVQTGEKVLIGGFIVTGSGAKKVLIRALGPSLTGNGIAGALADPTLELHDSTDALTTSNDNWKDSPDATAIKATGIPPTNPLESAIIANLNPNQNYTAIVRGKGSTTGIAVVEVYDLDSSTSPQLANLSTRGFVETGDNVMIGGFIRGGNNNLTRIALRGIGPSLSGSSVPNPLQDPTLELHDSNGAVLSSNDNWQDDPVSAAQLMASGLAPQNKFESGIFITLRPGQFTAILRGKNNTTGIGLVEVYNLQ